MKKIKIIQIIGISLVFIYLALLISDVVWGYLGDINTLVFSVILVCIGLNLIHKGVLLKSSSTLWFAMCLIIFAICIIILKLNNQNVQDFAYLFGVIPLISSFINFALFHAKIYIKVIILNMSILVPIFTSQFLNLQWFIDVGIGVMAIILGILICRNINLDKEKIDG